LTFKQNLPTHLAAPIFTVSKKKVTIRTVAPRGGDRDFVYRWDGHRLTLDDIIGVPPEKSTG
jgi:hypothetical protein